MSTTMEFVTPKIYCHINNGGVTFGVINDGGPTIFIQATYFSEITHQSTLHVTKDTLCLLGKMFLEAAKYDNYGKQAGLELIKGKQVLPKQK